MPKWGFSRWVGYLQVGGKKPIRFVLFCQENYSEAQLGILQSRTQDVRDDQESEEEQFEENEEEVFSLI